MNAKGYGYGYGNRDGEFNAVLAAKEAYRTIRTNLMFSVARSGCKTLVFTSSIQGEGKTTSAVNVAFSLARSEKRVLLIDMDLRRPRVNRLLKLKVAPGLTNYISGFNTFEEIFHASIYPNLDVITAGNLTPNPAEMAASTAVTDLLDSMKESYDYIILDTPPVNVISDALPLIKYSDGVVLVVRPKYTARSEVKNSIAQVEFVGGKILGVIANRVLVQKRGYGSGYGHYGSSYGSAYTKNDSSTPKLRTSSPDSQDESSEG